MSEHAELRRRYYVMLERLAPKWTIQEAWRFDDGDVAGFCIPRPMIEPYLAEMRSVLRKLNPVKHESLYWMVNDDIRGARGMLDNKQGYCVSWSLR